MEWSKTITDNLKGAGSVVDAFRDALDPDRKDVADTKAAEKWNWRPIAIALGGVVVVAIVLRMVFRK
jgi:hypothetical protein